jgi:hypothetical protein
MHPSNAEIALIVYYRRQATILRASGDTPNAELYEKAAEAAEMKLLGLPAMQKPSNSPPGLNRPEAIPNNPAPVIGE